MNRVQWALTIVSALMLLEALGGLWKPDLIKKLAAWWINTAGPAPRWLGVVFLSLAIFLAVLVLAGQPLAHWALLALAIVIAAAGALCFRKDSLRRWMEALIVHRSVVGVRMLYAVELLLALLLLWIARARWQVH